MKKKDKLKKLGTMLSKNAENPKLFTEGLLGLISTVNKLKKSNKKYKKIIHTQQDSINELSKMVNCLNKAIMHENCINDLYVEKSELTVDKYEPNSMVNPSEYEVKNPDAVRYGIKIDKTKDIGEEGKIEYILNAVGFTPAKMNFETGEFDYGSWKDVWFVKDNKPVLLSFNGTKEKELDPNDYSKFLNGNPVIKDSYDSLGDYVKQIKGNYMSKIPLTYLCEYEDERFIYVIVSDKEYDSSYIPIAHMNEHNEILDYIYLAMFRGSFDKKGKLRSIPSCSKYEIMPSGMMDMDTQIRAAKSNNLNSEGYNIRTWGQRQLINSLLMIMSCSIDSAESFGYGNNSTYKMNATGLLKDKGQFYGTNDGKTSVKIFHMEDWWGNQWERIAGLINDNGTIKVSLTGPYNTTGEGYIKVHNYSTDGTYTYSFKCGHIKKFKVTQYGLIPVEITEFLADSICGGDSFHIWDSDIAGIAMVGGNYYFGNYCGAYCLDLTTNELSFSSNIGCCLSFIKNPSKDLKK